MSHHIAIEGAQVGELCFVITGHLIDQAALAVHNFIVADGQDKIFTERIEEAERNFVMVAGTEQRVSLHVAEHIVHPAHVPLEVEAQAAVRSRLCGPAECFAVDLRPGKAFRGQKVHPTGVRVGIIKDWNSKWYANSKDFADYLVEDQKIRKFLKKKLYLAGISKIEIERTAKAIKVNLYTAKPGIVIGKGGAGVESVKAELTKLIGKDVNLNIVEVKNVDTDAQLVAENIAGQLERRISFRRAMKQCMQKTMKSGALGIKTSVSGRLGGADMARTEFYKEGNIPLQTLRADIDYGFAEADTTYGKIGVKVWIYKGEVLPERPVEGGDK